MKKLTSKAWWSDVAERAISTAAETVLTFVTVGQSFSEVNWISVLSVAGVSALISFLKNLVLLPDAEQ